MPSELDEVTRRVMQLEIEEAALSKETDQASITRLEAIRKEVSDLKRTCRYNEAAVGKRKAVDSNGARCPGAA